MKFIDDMTMAESINLKASLIKNPEVNPPRPFNYHERTQHIMAKQNFKLQTMLDDLKDYTLKHQMRVNENKTKVILFNSVLKYDFQLNLTLDNESRLEFTLGASAKELLEVYYKQIRCMVEFDTPVWTSGMTFSEIEQLERVQKCAFNIILSDSYCNYRISKYIRIYQNISEYIRIFQNIFECIGIYRKISEYI